MKISFIAENDWANVLTEYAYCLNKHSEGIEAKSICLNKHSFNYTIQHNYDLSDCTYDQGLEAQKFVFESDVIIFGEEGAMQPTNYKVLEIYKQILGIDLLNSDKKLLIWHPGSHYRQNPNFYNNHPLRNRIHKHLYAIDLYRLSPKNDNDLILPPYQYSTEINRDEFIDSFLIKLNQEKPIVLHNPSSNFKGTNEIVQSIDSIKIGKKYKVMFVKNLPHNKVIELKNKSLFYIDQYYPSTGSYGIAALEGILTGNITFSTLNKIGDVLEKLYSGKFPIISLGSNVKNMTKAFETYLVRKNKKDIEKLVYKTANWIEEFMIPQARENIFKNKILK